MNKVSIYAVIVSLSIFFLNNAGYTQGMHMAGHHYDPAKVVTVDGVISSVDFAAKGWGKNPGTHIQLKTGNETLTIFAGPSAFLQGKISLQKGDTIEVTGSRFTLNGIAGIVAKEIKSGSAKIILRKDDGTPLWAGHGWKSWH